MYFSLECLMTNITSAVPYPELSGYIGTHSIHFCNSSAEVPHQTRGTLTRLCWCLSRDALPSRMLFVTFLVCIQRQCSSFLETPLAPLHCEITELDMRRFQRASPLWKSARALNAERGFALWSERK